MSDKNELKQRKALAIAIIFLVAITTNLIISIIRDHPTGAWQHTVRIGIVVVFWGASVVSILRIRKGDVEKGLILLIRSFLFTLLGTILLLSGLGIIIAGISLIVTGSIAFSSLPKERRTAPLVASIVVAVAAYISDLLPLTYRIPAPATIKSIFTTVASVIVLAIAVLVIRTSKEAVQHYLQASVHNRLKAIVISASLIPVLLISLILGISTYQQGSQVLTKEAFSKLAAVQTIKKNQITAYLTERNADMEALNNTMGALFTEATNNLETINSLKHHELLQTYEKWKTDLHDLSSSPTLVAEFEDVIAAFHSLGAEQVRAFYLDASPADENNAYATAYNKQHPFLTEYISAHQYKNAFLIDTNGYIVYSVHNGDSFGTNLVTGNYQNSNLATLYHTLLGAEAGTVHFADAALFEDDYALFIGTPVYQGESQIGILVYQIDFAQIDHIMSNNAGLGTTGETFLVAQEPDGRITFRSNRTVIGNGKFVVGYDLSSFAPDFMKRALSGENGSDLSIGGTGASAFTTYQPVKIEELNWAILSRIDGEEVLVPKEIGSNKDFLSLYQESYDYTDILLIHPNGDIFYTVKKQDDYHTNIFTGAYKDSNLGWLISQIAELKQLEMADFAIYPPANMPVAFVGAPLLDEDNNIKMYVVAQISAQQINDVLTETTGLGNTGETYLLGQDKLWRSDSRFLEQLGVESTVLNENFKVDTVASQAALQKKSGQGVINSYGDRTVLSVWSPVIFDTVDSLHPEGRTWALIAEIDENEALGPVRQQAATLGFIVGLIALAIGALAIYLGSRFATGFVTPILNLTENATKVAAGDFDVSFETDRQDELGVLSKTFGSMTAQLKEMLQGLEARVTERTRALEISTEVSRRLSTILDKNELVKEVVEQLVKSFGYYYAHIYLFDEKKEKLVMMGGTGEAGKIMLSRGHALNIGQGLVGRAAEQNTIVLVKDTRNEENWLPNELLPETRSEIAVPISIGEEVLGVFDVQHNVLNGLTEEDASLMQSIANQIAIALQNAEAYERAQHQVKREELLSDISHQIQNTTSVEEALKIATRELGRALKTKTSIQLNPSKPEKNKN